MVSKGLVYFSMVIWLAIGQRCPMESCNLEVALLMVSGNSQLSLQIWLPNLGWYSIVGQSVGYIFSMLLHSCSHKWFILFACYFRRLWTIDLRNSLPTWLWCQIIRCLSGIALTVINLHGWDHWMSPLSIFPSIS